MNKVERFKEITAKMADLYEKKNADYGDSFGESHRKYGAIAGVVRMSDKLNRLSNLIQNKESKVADESVIDTLTDLANYAIMLRMEIEQEEKERIEIKVGDKFLCIKDCVLEPIHELAYSRNGVYTSEFEGCITDIDGDSHHKWEGDMWKEYFERVD